MKLSMNVLNIIVIRVIDFSYKIKSYVSSEVLENPIEWSLGNIKVKIRIIIFY